MRLALFEPDIPQNAGTMIRMGACLGIHVDIIEPCGFPFSDKSLKRAGMDYIDTANIKRHDSFEDFEAWRQHSGYRLVLLSTKAVRPYTAFRFQKDDIVMVGRESAGVPEHVHKSADARLRIPMQQKVRSLNVAVSAAMVIGEALRQTHRIEE